MSTERVVLASLSAAMDGGFTAIAIEVLGYTKTFGNRWERPIDDRRVATVDLLVPTYRSRARHTVKVSDVVTTEVPGSRRGASPTRPDHRRRVCLHTAPLQIIRDQTVTTA